MIEGSLSSVHVKDQRILLPITKEKFPKQADFLKTIEATYSILEKLQLSEQAIIISGGSVALRQMALGIDDRIPTDLDLIITYEDINQAEQILIELHNQLELSPGFTKTKLITDPRQHWAYLFDNPLLETIYTNNASMQFPVDFLTKMTTVFPQNYYLPELRGVAYPFPNDVSLMRFSQTIQVGPEQVKVAHPAFALFYKLTMNRNGNNPDQSGCPKQDDQDLLRMLNMGLINPSDPEFSAVLDALTYGNQELLDQFLGFLDNKITELGKNA